MHNTAQQAQVRAENPPIHRRVADPQTPLSCAAQMLLGIVASPGCSYVNQILLVGHVFIVTPIVGHNTRWKAKKILSFPKSLVCAKNHHSLGAETNYHCSVPLLHTAFGQHLKAAFHPYLRGPQLSPFYRLHATYPTTDRPRALSGMVYCTLLDWQVSVVHRHARSGPGDPNRERDTERKQKQEKGKLTPDKTA